MPGWATAATGSTRATSGASLHLYITAGTLVALTLAVLWWLV